MGAQDRRRESSTQISYRCKSQFITNNTLKRFVNLKVGQLEKTESLEQLRALENGIDIIVGKVNKAPYSIDTLKDLKFFLKNESIK